MDGIHIGDLRRADDAVDAQVAFAGGRFADADGLVGQLHVHRVGIRLGIDGHGADVQFLAGADDANGNFSAIGYQNFFKHAVSEALRYRARPDVPSSRRLKPAGS